MARPALSSPVALVATLGLGIGLGLSAGRTLPGLTAQVAALPNDRPPRPEGASAKAGSEDDSYRKLAAQYEQFHGINRTFAEVARVVSPAVVHIVARKTGHRRDGHAFLYEESGSGVIVRAGDGRGLYVLTNNHVVEGAPSRDIQVVLHDGRVFHPDRAASDPSTDVAVLRLGAEGLPAARLGDSDDTAVGTWVLALGSPFGLTQSVTAGIISARGRHEDELAEGGNVNQEYLQTDAAINPGNSGGPLVNLKGEVIGINTAIASNGGGSEGVGFSIPINLAHWAMDQLIARGKVTRGALGVHLDSLEARRAEELGLDRPRGAIIETIVKDSPAERAGLVVGDVLLSYRGQGVRDANHLINLISQTPVGSQIDIVVWRDGKPFSSKVEVIDRDFVLAQEPTEPPTSRSDGPIRRAPRPEVPTQGVTARAQGLELVTLDASTARRLGLPETTRGVAVAKVEPDSPLAAVFRPMDVINSVGGRRVRSVEEVIRALKPPGDRPTTELGVQRPEDGGWTSLTVRLP